VKTKEADRGILPRVQRAFGHFSDNYFRNNFWNFRVRCRKPLTRCTEVDAASGQVYVRAFSPPLATKAVKREFDLDSQTGMI